MKFKIGPAALVAAAFIGPGTVTTCTVAGARFGHALLWTMVFSIIATIILQEMSARLGIVARKGLGQALREEFVSGPGRVFAIILVVSAIAIGNAAYETGNILGASLGLEALSGVKSITSAGLQIPIWPLLIGSISFLALYFGNYKFLERALIALVILMSLTFLVTMVVIGPELLSVLKGLVIPRIPKGSMLMVAGLIGTTVVPYNLFLHASLVQEKWKHAADLAKARTDIRISIILGGVVSLSVIITAAAAFYGQDAEITSGADLATQLRPVLGDWAGVFMGLGLFAAGITSAITAPLAAAYATTGILGWKMSLKSKRFRLIWMTVLLIGVLFSVLGFKPVSAIIFAQAANGILLPVIAGYLLYVMNSKKLMQQYVNSKWINLLGLIVLVISVLISVKTFIVLFS